jgi:hypothetical protein
VRSRGASGDEVRRPHHGTEALDAFLPAITVFVHECWSTAPIKLQDGKDYKDEGVTLRKTRVVASLLSSGARLSGLLS